MTRINIWKKVYEIPPSLFVLMKEGPEGGFVESPFIEDYILRVKDKNGAIAQAVFISGEFIAMRTTGKFQVGPKFDKTDIEEWCLDKDFKKHE